MINVSAPKVAIIVVNWNNWRDTIECLGSLEKVDYPNFEVVVVDNGSTNDSLEKIRSYELGVIVLETGRNLGFAGGNNYALRNFHILNTKYILLLNNDTIVHPDFLKELVRVAESNDRMGIVGPMIYFYDKPDYINSAGSRVNRLMNKGVYLGYGEKDVGQFGIKPYEVDYISGACLLIKKEVIEKIGPLHDNYFLYYEDTDWNFQARKAKYKSVLVPTAKIWHKESASAKRIGLDYIYYHVRNGLLFNRRCAPFYKRIMAQFYNVYVFSKQIIKLFIPSKRKWARAALRGIYDYYRGQFGPINPKV